MFKRYIQLRAADLVQPKSESGLSKLRIMASTSDAVDMGGWREILEHSEASVDTGSATALLINHDPNRIAGALRACVVDGKCMEVEAELDDSVEMESGMTVKRAIDIGAMRGASVGYSYDRKDCIFDESTRTVTVKKWRLLELSLTPTPADAAAGIRSMPFDFNQSKTANEPKERTMSESAPAAPVVPAGDPDISAKMLRLERENKIRALAEQHGVKADGLDFDKSEIDLAGDLMKRKAELAQHAPAGPVTRVSVTVDGGDKFIEAAGKSLAGERDGIQLHAVEMVRRCAKIEGEDASDWSASECASYALRRMSYSKRDAANKTASSFAVLTGSTANKQLLAGFDGYASVWAEICTIKDASDFNTHYHVGAATGRLQETPENEAFPELVQKEGSYSSAVKNYGATISITEQAIVNDNLGEIMRSFQRAGYAAARAIDRAVFYALLNATWTYDTTAGAALGTAGNLDKVRAGLKGKLSPSGEKMENEPRILVVDTLNAYNAALATGQIYKINETVAGGSPRVTGIKVIDSTFVGDTGLLAGALTTDYYLFNDPNMVDTVCLEFLRGMRVPQIQPFDAGAVDAVKFKIKLPFAATIATHTDSAGNTRVTGVQKATVA